MKFHGLVLGLLLILLAVNISTAQYSIKVKVNGVNDSTMMLGHHFGSKKYVVDTAHIDSKGWAHFEGKEDLDKGIYIIILPSLNNTYFECLIGDDMEFSLETDTENYVENMKVKGCKENLIFNDYQREMAVLNRERMELDELMNKHSENPDSVEIIRNKIIENGEKRKQYMLEVIANSPESFFAKVLNSMVEIDVPEPPRDDEGNITDSTFQWRYYKEHYFDNVDFSEGGLLKTPIFEGKLNYFFKNVVVPEPDSLINQANIVIQKAYEGGDTLMFRFVAA
ncbi:MAG: DUF5106 domain-containing protein, partial [Bacteroidales bacterium]|nr:DUF5106 domain-containing protein [Bacteroidales bacterium]